MSTIEQRDQLQAARFVLLQTKDPLVATALLDRHPALLDEGPLDLELPPDWVLAKQAEGAKIASFAIAHCHDHATLQRIAKDHASRKRIVAALKKNPAFHGPIVTAPERPGPSKANLSALNRFFADWPLPDPKAKAAAKSAAKPRSSNGFLLQPYPSVMEIIGLLERPGFDPAQQLAVLERVLALGGELHVAIALHPKHPLVDPSVQEVVAERLLQMVEGKLRKDRRLTIKEVLPVVVTDEQFARALEVVKRDKKVVTAVFWGHDLPDFAITRPRLEMLLAEGPVLGPLFTSFSKEIFATATLSGFDDPLFDELAAMSKANAFYYVVLGECFRNGQPYLPDRAVLQKLLQLERSQEPVIRQRLLSSPAWQACVNPELPISYRLLLCEEFEDTVRAALRVDDLAPVIYERLHRLCPDEATLAELLAENINRTLTEIEEVLRSQPGTAGSRVA